MEDGDQSKDRPAVRHMHGDIPASVSEVVKVAETFHSFLMARGKPDEMN